jgi:hypothetical protein
MSYSKLNDKRKRAAVLDFAYYGNALAGLSVTVLVDKRIKSLFRSGVFLDPLQTDVGGKIFTRWKPHVFERVMRAVYFVALFVAGVSAPAQDVIWITDEDEIAPTVEGLTDLTHVFGSVLAGMVPHRLGHVRVGTTGTTAGDGLVMEDLTAVADIIGGAVNELIGGYGDAVPLSAILSPQPARISSRLRDLGSVLFDDRAPLRKILFLVEPIPGSEALRFSAPKIQLYPALIQP